MKVYPEWTPRLGRLGPMFADLERALRGRLPAGWPEPERLVPLLGSGIRTGAGKPLRPERASGARLSALAYERQIYERGELPLREGSWHDVFNALSWALFPLTKAAINRAHVTEPFAGNRSRRRDALTLLDESGVICAVTEPDYEALNRQHDWLDFFWYRRGGWGRSIVPLILGHGLLEQCLAPYRGLTAKALYLRVPRGFGALPAARRFALLDGLLAPRITTLASPRDLLPLPLLGIPGWDPANADPAFYDDRGYFRPRRDPR